MILAKPRICLQRRQRIPSYAGAPAVESRLNLVDGGKGVDEVRALPGLDL